MADIAPAGRTAPNAALLRARPYLAAVVALALVMAVASLGGTRHRTVATAAGNATTADATSSGIPLGDIGATPTGDTVAAAGTDAATGSAGANTNTGAPTGTGATGTKANGSAPAPNTPGAPARHATYDQGASDTEVRIGGSTFTSGPAAVYGEQIAVGFAAGVNYVNAHGGVNGRRITLKLYDDGADPARQLANTKRLVEVDKVFALAMVYADIAGDYVRKAGIPVYHLGQNQAEFTNPNWFPLGGPQRLASFSLSNFGAKTLGVKSVAVFYIDAGAANYSRAYAEQVAKDWKGYGVSVPLLESFAPDQTSCDSAIADAKKAGVDFIQFEIDAGKVINCGVSAQLNNYKPPKGWGGYLIGVPVIHQALGQYSEGMYAFDAFGPDYKSQDYIDAVRKVSAKTETYSSTTISYFIAALLLRDSLAKVGDNVTRKAVIDTLNTFTNWNPGLTTDPAQPTWTWNPSCHVALKGGYVIQIKKQADGTLAWTEITPPFSTTYIPPGQTPPPEFAACKIFTQA